MSCSYCQKPKIVAKNLCSACYYHLQRHGTLVRKIRKRNTCIVDGCSGQVVSNQLCDKHRIRQAKFGRTDFVNRPDDWGKRTSHPRYKAWNSMIRRCQDPKNKDYPRYGARGITVSEDWLDFWTFIEETGEPPSPKHSLDRIDNDGPYSKKNTKWSTARQQARNRRDTIVSPGVLSQIVDRYADGESMAEIAKSTGISMDLVRYGIRSELKRNK